MGYRRYTAQYKAKIVLEVLQGEKELGEIAAENNLNPNMVRNWKREFLENASAAFEDPRKAEKGAKKKEDAQRRETARRAADAGAGLSSRLLSPLGRTRPGV